MCILYYPLSTDKIIDWFKRKALADDNSNVAKLKTSVFDSVVNIVGN